MIGSSRRRRWREGLGWHRGCGTAGVHGHLQKLSSDILEPTSTKPSEFAGSSMCRSPSAARGLPPDLGARILRD